MRCSTRQAVVEDPDAVADDEELAGAEESFTDLKAAAERIDTLFAACRDVASIISPPRS